MEKYDEWHSINKAGNGGKERDAVSQGPVMPFSGPQRSTEDPATSRLTLRRRVNPTCASTENYQVTKSFMRAC